MARKAHGRPPGVEYEFIPTSFGNDKDDDPVTFWISPPDHNGRRALVSFHTIELSLNESIQAMEKAARQYVKRVENYTAPDGSEIKNGKDLAKSGETLFLKEILDECLGATELDEEEKKDLSA